MAVFVSLLPVFAAPTTGIIESGKYPDDAAARSAWKPMRDTLPVSVASRDGAPALRFPCRFKANDTERASWDRAVNLDLSAAPGIEFQVLCPDASPVSHFSIYFESGAGWYQALFFPENSGVWTTVRIRKKEFDPEGNPAGWNRLKTIRISAWRSGDTDTEFYVRDLRMMGGLRENALVAVVRGDTAMERLPDQAASIADAAEAISRRFEELNIPTATLSDRDLGTTPLNGLRLLVFPYNPAMPDAAQAATRAFMAKGGRALAFYTFPESLQRAFQVRAGTHVKEPRAHFFAAIQPLPEALPGAPAKVLQGSWNINAFQPIPGVSRVLAEWIDEKGKTTGYPAIIGSSNTLVFTHLLLPGADAARRRLLLSMAGFLVPEVWAESARGAIDRVGRVSKYNSWKEAESDLVQGALGNPAASGALEAARKLRTEAMENANARKFSAAVEKAEQAEKLALEAFCRMQKSEPEFRAFWCHSAYGLRGLEWDEAIDRLAQNGFNAILPNMLWGGAAFYESQVLPRARGEDRRDQIKLCLEAAHKRGVQVHVWKVNWNLGSAAPKDFVEQMRRERRLQADSGGKEEPWLCPSDPRNQRLEIESMVEIVRKYPVDGIHFDYIRYPDANHCFCAGCRERFAAHIGKPMTDWPKAVLTPGALRQTWLDWRRSNITAVVKAVSAQARAADSKIKISAAVFRNWPTDRDHVGQDWKAWCDAGYLDFVCPMDYTPSNGSFESAIVRQVKWAGRVPCYPGIGASASRSHLGPDRVIEQINLTRRQHTGGFVIFNYGVLESEEILPYLGMGITRPTQP